MSRKSVKTSVLLVSGELGEKVVLRLLVDMRRTGSKKAEEDMEWSYQWVERPSLLDMNAKLEDRVESRMRAIGEMWLTAHDGEYQKEFPLPPHCHTPLCIEIAIEEEEIARGSEVDWEYHGHSEGDAQMTDDEEIKELQVSLESLVGKKAIQELRELLRRGE
jgi:hypothetical protein